MANRVAANTDSFFSIDNGGRTTGDGVRGWLNNAKE
jgi:hypothetical protein